MVVWNSMLLKIIIILLGVVKQHVRFIFLSLVFFLLQEFPVRRFFRPINITIIIVV
jgi:hypothetical protein